MANVVAQKKRHEVGRSLYIVARMATLRELLYVAVERNLHLQKLDVKSALLKSLLKVPVFRKLPENESYPDEHRLYFRRLSQTTQTDVLLGNLDMTGSGKVILRPLSVQERIRELNLRARMFTDTMLAIQGISPRHSPLPGPRSLQCSPWSSPRILSPVDVRHILASRSTENLSGLASHGELVGSPIRRRWSRRSLRRSVPSKSRSPESYREYEEVGRKEAEKLLRDGEEELRLHLESLSNRDRVITAHEAKSLVALLHSHDELLLERTLITIANCGTFSANQIQDAIPLLLTFVNKEQPTEKLLLSALLTLSNIAVLSDWHDEFYPVLHALYQLVDTGAPQVKLQALKLLVNLSCNEDMVPSLLAAQAPRRLIYFLDPSTNEDILLRVVTLLANLTTAAKEQKLDPTIDLPAEDKAASPDTIALNLLSPSQLNAETLAKYGQFRRPLYLSSALAQAMPPTLSTAWTAPQSTFSEPSVTRVLNMVVPRNIVLTPSLPTVTLPPIATHVARTNTLPPIATHAAGTSTLSPHLGTSSHSDSRYQDVIMFHHDSRCQDILLLHRDSCCRDFMFHRDSRVRDILLFHWN
uniref:Armadillo repeat-containing domain-containing protein n=1 Tax=Timema poppense TaxID=170557 RepID=A0A7R9D533_TIMPO|nr:unnamed protein product [Timema poppensis]